MTIAVAFDAAQARLATGAARQWLCKLALLALLPVIACTQFQPNQPTLTSEVYDVPLAGVEAPPGVSEHVVLVRGQRRRFGIWIPPPAERERHPVILFLHGAQRYPSFGFLQGLVESGLAPLAPIVIAPEASLGHGGEWWRGEEASYALGLLRSALETWPIDDRKVVVMGYSNGGIGAWILARAYPQYFTAAIPVAFPHSVVGGTPVPVFAIQGEKDELFGSADVIAAIEELKKQGQDVTLAVLPRGSHYTPERYGAQIEQARRWLQQLWAPLGAP